MDQVIYIAMTGAREVARQQAVVTQNLSNLSTDGFKAEISVFRALPVVGEGAKTRAYVAETTPTADFSQGTIQQTGRPLDVAVNGSGWIAVQGPDGSEAYTRAGDLQVSQNGILETGSGLPILGDSGPIAVPPDQRTTIAQDGTVSSTPVGQNLNSVTVDGRIRLVNPPVADLVRGDDGLFRLRNGGTATADANVTLAVGAVETSNVSPTQALVNMISLARQFEMQTNVIKAANANDQSANKVLSS